MAGLRMRVCRPESEWRLQEECDWPHGTGRWLELVEKSSRALGKARTASDDTLLGLWLWLLLSHLPSSSSISQLIISPSPPIPLLHAERVTIPALIAMQAFRRPLSSALQQAARRQGYATNSSQYGQTVGNLRINSDTKVVFQGFTGRQGTSVLALNPPGVRRLTLSQLPRPASYRIRYEMNLHGAEMDVAILRRLQEQMSSAAQTRRRLDKNISESQFSRLLRKP